MVSITIKRSCRVKPCEPTPEAKLWLPECDQVKAYTHAPVLYAYRPDAANLVSSAFETLKSSLAQALVTYYPLAGCLNWIDGNRFELHCNSMGAELVEAEADAEISDFGDFRPTTETRKLLPYVDYGKDITELPLVLVQLTRFKCGGITIGTEISHIAADGRGALGFIGLWAKLAQGEKVHVEPCHDRTVFYKGDPSAKPRFGHIELKASPLLLGKQDAEEERLKETTTTMLKLSKDQVDNLKQLANQGRAKDAAAREYSRYEAMGAHIWRSMCKARKLQKEQITSLRTMVDCRNRLHPPLPPVYYGNAVMPTTARADVGTLLSSPLSYACSLISQSVDKVNDDYIKSATDFLSSLEDIAPYRTGFHSVKLTGGRFLGNPNLAITSWFGLPVKNADFGWGKPIFMGPADLGFDGRMFIIPVIDEEGAFNIPIRLQVTHMDDFVKYFYQDLPARIQKFENGVESVIKEVGIDQSLQVV